MTYVETQVRPTTRLITMVDPSGVFSKLSRSSLRMCKVHRTVRAGSVTARPGPRADAKQRIEVSEAALRAAEAHYLDGATLREVAASLGISHPRLAAILRKRGIRVRRSSPSDAEVDEMVYRYEHGESLARIGEKLGFQPNTVRTHLLERGIPTRDSHGRVR